MKPTIIISRASDGDAERRAFEDAVIRLLVESERAPVLVVPSIYFMTESDAGLAAVRETPGDIFLASWRYPRAAFWLLRSLGVQGDPPDGSCQGCSGSESCFASGGRRIFSVYFGSFDSPKACAERLIEPIRGRHPREHSLREIQGDVRPRWYPVIDYSLCTVCGQCHDFCLFGVYSLDQDSRPEVTSPDRCKPGCAACARICPEGAIIFPLYLADPGIAGADGKRPAPVANDVEAFFKRGEPCPLCGCRCDCARSTDGTAPPGKKVCPACGCICDEAGPCACKPHLALRPGRPATAKPAAGKPRDELDDLIDELDKLDV